MTHDLTIDRADAAGREVDRLNVLPSTRSLVAAHTIMRDRSTSRAAFRLHARRVFRTLLEHALGLLPHDVVDVSTPAGHTYRGLRVSSRVSAVSVVRAGESLETELLAIDPAMDVGKILIQRDRATKLPHLGYSHLPPGIEHDHVLLLEPMLATGGSLLAAVAVLADAGVPPSRIIAVSVLASPEGLQRVLTEHPRLRLVTSSVEEGLDDRAFMVPGVGDFGDRYFGTDGHDR